ncbi:hypothetical protein [Brevibacillus composti]
MAAVLQVFSQKGYAASTATDIAREADFSFLMAEIYRKDLSTI